MDWSTRKRMGCFSIIGIVVFVVLGYIIYVNFFKTTPTCFDRAQNQDERGIDCGGVCSLVCSADAKVIVPLWSRVFNTTGDVYSAVTYLENQNSTAGIKSFSYEFRVYDKDNILAAEPLTGTTFLAPRDKTAIYVSPLKTGNRIPQTAFFRITSTPVWETADARYTVPQLKTESFELTDRDTAPKLTAEIRNDTLYDYRDIEVVAILYNKDGNAINASKTVIDELPQQSTQKVYFTWPKSFDEEVSRIEVIPRLNPYIQQ